MNERGTDQEILDNEIQKMSLRTRMSRHGLPIKYIEVVRLVKRSKARQLEFEVIPEKIEGLSVTRYLLSDPSLDWEPVVSETYRVNLLGKSHVATRTAAGYWVIGLGQRNVKVIVPRKPEFDESSEDVRCLTSEPQGGIYPLLPRYDGRVADLNPAVVSQFKRTKAIKPDRDPHRQPTEAQALIEGGWRRVFKATAVERDPYFVTYHGHNAGVSTAEVERILSD